MLKDLSGNKEVYDELDESESLTTLQMGCILTAIYTSCIKYTDFTHAILVNKNYLDLLYKSTLNVVCAKLHLSYIVKVIILGVSKLCSLPDFLSNNIALTFLMTLFETLIKQKNEESYNLSLQIKPDLCYNFDESDYEEGHTNYLID
jgi:hypothetical protein